MADDFINNLGGDGADQPPGGGGGGGTNAGTTADIQRNQILNGGLNALLGAVQAAFPQASTSITHSATAGPDTLPAKPAGFLTVSISGVSYKVPIYEV